MSTYLVNKKYSIYVIKLTIEFYHKHTKLCPDYYSNNKQDNFLRPLFKIQRKLFQRCDTERSTNVFDETYPHSKTG